MSDDIIHFGGKVFKATGKDASGRTLYSPAVFNALASVTADNAGKLKMSTPRRLRQDSKPLMNKLETEWFGILKASNWMTNLRAQAKRYKLGNGIWYKPDMTGNDTRDGRETAYEVKGPHAFRGGFENLKVAASQWQDVTWLLVWKQDGEWKQQRVLP